jgi:hypothetical protein
MKAGKAVKNHLRMCLDTILGLAPLKFKIYKFQKYFNEKKMSYKYDD